MALYKNVLHHPDNSFPKKVLEALGTYVSLLNECDYCVKHHFAGLVRLVGEAHGAELMNAMKKHDFAGVLDDDQDVLFRYAKALTETPAKCQEEFNAMREAGYRDGEILEVNQVVSYFNYANRTVLGLGVVTEGDVLGLSPGDMDDDGNWTHQ